MNDNLITCPISGGNACYYIKNENGHEAWFSYSAGYASDSTKKLGTETQEQFESLLPQLYKDLRWIDPETQCVWYPVSHNEQSKGIVFVDGTSVEDWKWAAMKTKRLTKQEQKSGKYGANNQYVTDATTLKKFERMDFIEALDYIGGFNA